MTRFLAALALLPLILFFLLSSVSARGISEQIGELSPTVQPTTDPFQIDVTVETLGTGIPDNVILQTDFGDLLPYRHDVLGANRYRDVVQVPLNSSTMWIFEHEGDLGIGGSRNDESWELFPYIVPTPFTVTVSLHDPTAPCQDPTLDKCNYVNGSGEPLVFTLEHNTSYSIMLNVNYTRGDSYSQDTFMVTSTIQSLADTPASSTP